MANNSKKTIVFFSMDALGHIHPILPVVKELTRRGHRAIVLTTRQLSLEAKFRAEGYDFQSCMQAKPQSQQPKIDDIDDHDKLREIMLPLVESFRVGLPETYKVTYTLTGAAGKHFQDMVDNHDLIEEKLKSLKPDLIVFDHIVAVPCTSTVAPKWVRIYSGFPMAIYSSLFDNCVAGLGLKPSEMTQEWKQFELNSKGPLREKIRRFWAEKGLTDWEAELDLAPTSPYLNICFGPDELSLEKYFGPLPEVWNRLEHTIVERDQKSEFNLPEEFERLPGKLIYFSLGTLVTNDIDLINRLLDIMSKSPHKFIVSKGQMHKFIKLYPNMWGDKFLDQRAILPKVDLFITHGGHNSIVEAFYYGVPGLIVLPVFADQFDGAQQIENCGLGVRLNPFKCTEQELLTSIDLILQNRQLAEQMSSIGVRMRSIKYHEKLTDKLEQLLM